MECQSGRAASDVHRRPVPSDGRVAAVAGGEQRNGSRFETRCGRAALGLCCRPATRPPQGLATAPVSATDRRRDQSGCPGAERVDSGLSRSIGHGGTAPVRTNMTRRHSVRSVVSSAGYHGLGRPRAWSVKRYRGVVLRMGPPRLQSRRGREPGSAVSFLLPTDHRVQSGTRSRFRPGTHNRVPDQPPSESPNDAPTASARRERLMSFGTIPNEPLTNLDNDATATVSISTACPSSRAATRPKRERWKYRIALKSMQVKTKHAAWNFNFFRQILMAHARFCRPFRPL